MKSGDLTQKNQGVNLVPSPVGSVSSTVWETEADSSLSFVISSVFERCHLFTVEQSCGWSALMSPDNSNRVYLDVMEDLFMQLLIGSALVSLT